MEARKQGLWCLVCMFLTAGLIGNGWAAEKIIMTFEDLSGHDKEEIGDHYPGVLFEEINTGDDWIVNDIVNYVSIGPYNASSWPSGDIWGCDIYGNCGRYWIYDYVATSTGISGEGGKITFDNPYTFSVELGYSCSYPLTLTAYDADDTLLDSDEGPANLRGDNGTGNQDGPGTLRVDAPPGKTIKYVILQSYDNLWVVDNIKAGSRLDLVKFDDVNELTECVSPDSADPNLMYTIGISSKYHDQTNITLVDHLPREADFVSADPEETDPNYGYNWITHTYTWHLDELAGYDPPSDANLPFDPNTYFRLYTRVNYMAEPMSEIVNTVTAVSDQWETEAETATPICCWGGEVIYVDRHAPGYVQIGTSWQTAYRDLQDALARAKRGCANVIQVADGVYSPSDEFSEYPAGDTFEIPADVSVYGGYAGYGAADPDARDPKRYRTILSGYVNESERNNTVVTITGDDALLDGVTVKEGAEYGIYGNGFSFLISNCFITNNPKRGIDCENGNLSIQWSEIKESGQEGIYHQGSNKFLLVENCKIHDNQFHGILTASSVPTIINSMIYQNGLSSTYYNPYYGINLANPGSGTTIRSNTIVHNTKEGIRRSGGSTGTVKNNIVYFNNDEGSQLVSISPTYCCIQNWTGGGTGNISSNPVFAYNQPPYGYYHIRYESPCRDGGDSGYYTGETDMDNEDRVQESTVDIGADECSCEDTWHEDDWTYDGVINYEDFAILSHAWLSCDPNVYTGTDPNLWVPWRDWGKKCDLYEDEKIDLSDLVEFCEDDPQVWLWEACWRENYRTVWGMTAGTVSVSMMSQPLSMETLYSVQSLQTESVQPVYEPSPAELAETITQVLDFLDGVLEEENPENEEGILEIKAYLEDWLDEIESE